MYFLRKGYIHVMFIKKTACESLLTITMHGLRDIYESEKFIYVVLLYCGKLSQVRNWIPKPKLD